MKHKVPGLVFVLAVALGVVSVAVKTPRPAPIPGVVFAPKAEPEAASLAAAQPTILTKEVPRMDRAAASFRVFENGIVDGMDFRGAQYHARISNTEVRFGTEEGSLLLGNPRIEQGAVTVAGTEPAFTHPAFGTARLERGAFSEEYVFENRRMEQLFHIPAPLGRGALKVSVPLQTSFASVVETRAPNSGTFDAAEFRDGGVAVLDTAGNLKFTCASAVAWDSGKNRITLSPRYEGGRIVMDVPESFMAKAVFPIVIDPWFGSSGSNAAGGLSGTAKTSDRPSMKDNLVAWADSSSGNFEIYARLWTGSGFSDLGGSSTGGGISATPGDSLNPCVASNGSGNPTIAWEEHTGAGVAIFLKQFPRVATGGQWAGLGESATNLGISQNFASNRRPAVGLLQAVVPGIVTINPTNGQPISSPATFPIVPVVAWDSGQIYVSAFYPGAPAIPPVGAAPGLPAVPAGWYQLGKAGGINVTSTFNANLFIGFGQNSSLVVDGLNQVTVAWDGVLGNNVEIQASRW
ncbi:MAG TPA: hypothetical protein VE981_21040, partial [Planctomycetota bacterium]|nr:hypothetical protein [Planctomycetota bacterium]